MWVCICCSLLSSSAILWVRSCSWRSSPIVPSPPYQLAPPRALYALLSPSRSGPGLCLIRRLLDRLGRFSCLLWSFYGRDPRGQRGDDASVLPIALVCLLQLFPQGRDGFVFGGYERGAIRLRLAGVLAGVLSWPAGVQQDPHAAVAVPLVGNSPPLDPLSEGVHGGAEMIGRLRDANTLGGRRSCRVLSVLSHEGILPLPEAFALGPGPSSAVGLAGFFKQLDISHGGPGDERPEGMVFFGAFLFDCFYGDSTGVVVDQPSVEAAPAPESHGYSLSVPLLRQIPGQHGLPCPPAISGHLTLRAGSRARVGAVKRRQARYKRLPGEVLYRVRATSLLPQSV